AAADDTIDFALNYPATITLTSGELLLDKSLTIKGPGAPFLKVSGNHTSRVFNVALGTTVALSGLTIADGHGGGIDNGGTLTISNSTVADNAAANFGGRIANAGTLTIINSTVAGNVSGDQTSGISTSAGGIANAGTLTIINSTVSGNSALAVEGGTLGGGINN